MEINKKYIQRLIKIGNKLLLVIPILLFLYNCKDLRFIQDDAFTSLRYVNNFLDGNGLVFNPGERVEGYTNFMWVLILSFIGFGFKLSVSFLSNPEICSLKQFLENSAQILSIIFSIASLIISSLFSMKLFSSKNRPASSHNYLPYTATFLLLIMMVYTTPMVYWGVSGMETSLFTFLTLLSIYLFCFRKIFDNINSFMVVSVLNSFVRPEGLIVWGAISIYYVFNRFNQNDEFNFKKKIEHVFNYNFIKPFFIYLIPICIYTAFRLTYYGYPFPNTFYAKTEFSIEFIERGVLYIYSFAKTHLLFGGVFIPIIFVRLRNKLDENEKLLLWFIAVIMGYIIFIGGDVLPIHRFFMPVFPFIYILFLKSSLFILSEYVKKGIVKEAVLGIFAVVIIVFTLNNYSYNRSEMQLKRSYEIGLVSKMKIYASFINEFSNVKNKKERVSVAMSTIGAFSFYSGVRVIDLVGLTDEYTAHNPKETLGIDKDLPVLWKERHYNADYVMARKPDYIIFPAGAKPSAFAECALYVHPDFYRHYYMQLFYSKELQQLLPIFTRKENVRIDYLHDCSNKYLINFINANNIFLKMLETKNSKLITEMNLQLDEMLKKCPNRISEVFTLKGMAFYHLRSLVITESYLERALVYDSTNTIARYYLMNLYNLQNKKELALKTLTEVLNYSPKAIPNSFQ